MPDDAHDSKACRSIAAAQFARIREHQLRFRSVAPAWREQACCTTWATSIRWGAAMCRRSGRQVLRMRFEQHGRHNVARCRVIA